MQLRRQVEVPKSGHIGTSHVAHLMWWLITLCVWALAVPCSDAGIVYIRPRQSLNDAGARVLAHVAGVHTWHERQRQPFTSRRHGKRCVVLHCARSGCLYSREG